MSNIVKINDTDMQVIEYQGQRVAALAQIDAVHSRPEGTAGRNFREHKHRFIEGQDFFEVDQPDEIRRLGFERPQGGTPSKIILMTEQGYTMLVKPFTDDLAWQVQRQVVTGYFRAKVEGSRRAAVKQLQDSSRVRAWLMIGKAVAGVRGVKPEIAMSVTLDAIEKDTGLPATSLRLALPGATVQEAAKLNPTKLGERLGGKSAKAVNLALIALGFMVKGSRDNEITEAGKQYGEMVPYTRHGHSGYQPLWYEPVLEHLQAHFASKMNVVPLQGSV